MTWRAALRALAACAVLAIPAPAAATMFRGDLSHSGIYPPGAGEAFAGLRWSFRTRGPVRGSPVLAGDTLLIGSGDGNLYALDARNGRERWRRDLGGAVASSPAVAGGLVFVTSRPSRLAALELSTGKVRWKYEMGPDLPFRWGWDFWLSSPAVADGRVFVGGGDGKVHALEAATGRVFWQAETGGRVRSSPAVADGIVYVGSMDGRLHALDEKTGATRFAFEAQGASNDSAKAGFDRTSIVSSPAVSGDLVYFGSRDAHLYAVDRRTGRERWRIGHRVEQMEGSPVVSWILGSPAVATRRVFVGTSDGRFFQAVDAESGEERWRFKTPKNVLSSAAISGHEIYFGCEEGHLFALDARTGRERWRFRTGGAVISSPAVSEGLVYFGSDDGAVYALATGAPRPGSRPRRAVYWKDAGPNRWFRGDTAVRDYFRGEGYAVLDEAALTGFLEDFREAKRSVLVVAGDALPTSAAPSAGAPEDTPFRRFLAAGGRAIWLGLPPDCFEVDEKTGSLVRYDPTRTRRLLGVDHSLGSFDWMGATTTPEGRRWGLPEWYLGGFGVPPAEVTTVLGLDEFGLATSWVKSYGGPEGSGFVRLWGREDPIPDLSWVQAVAEHVE